MFFPFVCELRQNTKQKKKYKKKIQKEKWTEVVLVRDKIRYDWASKNEAFSSY